MGKTIYKEPAEDSTGKTALSIDRIGQKNHAIESSCGNRLGQIVRQGGLVKADYDLELARLRCEKNIERDIHPLVELQRG